MEIEKAFKRLLVRNPFYGLFCLSLPKEITRKVPTLSVSRSGINCQLNINPDFWEQYDDDEQIALLQHELSHIALQHMFIDDSFSDHRLFNVAADCEVNSYIENLPINAMTAAALSNQLGVSLQNGLGTKKYYEEIQKSMQKQQAQAQNPQQPCNGGAGGNDSSQQQENQNPSQSSSPSNATEDKEQQENNTQEEQNTQDNTEQTENNSQVKSQPQPEKEQEEAERPQMYPDALSRLKPIDDHSTWKDFHNIPDANKQLISNNINSVLKQTAEQVEKMHGTIPGEFSEIIDKLREKKPEVFNWKAYFRRLLGSIYDVNIRSTRRKQSKRFEGSAGIQHKKKVSILVAIDTSGSVSEKELKEFFSEIDYVYKAGARVTIIQCDTHINDVSEYDGKNIPTIKGRGGTSFDPPVDYYYKHRKEYATLIYFTDGEALLPCKKPAGMVWVISSLGYHQDYPGKVIYIPKENN